MKKIIFNFKFLFQTSIAALIFSIVIPLVTLGDSFLYIALLMFFTALLVLPSPLYLYRQAKKLEKYIAILSTFHVVIKNCQKTIRDYLEPYNMIPSSKTLDDLIKALDNRDLVSAQNEFESL